MSGYPHKTLSFSALNQFQGYFGCEMAFWFNRIDHTPPDKPKGQQLVLGTAFDAAAMAAHNGTLAGERITPDDAIGVAIDAWNMEMDTGEYETNIWSGLPGLLPSAVRQYVTDVVPQIRPIATQHELFIEFDEVPWAMTGRIDLLATLMSGEGEIVWDTKATAGSTKYDPQEDLQLGLYALGREFEGHAPARVGFQTARIQKTQARIEITSVESTPEARERSHDLLVEGATAIADACTAGRFRPTARLGRSPKCSEKYCEFYPSTCPYGARSRTAVAVDGLA